MAEVAVKKKKSKDADGKKSSKKKDKDGESSKRSSSPKKEKKVTLVDPMPDSALGSADFEAGVIFNRFDKAQRGVLTAEEFRQIWREGKLDNSSKQEIIVGSTTYVPAAGLQRMSSAQPTYSSFEAGQIFSKFDTKGDGRIDKKDFENVLRDHPELLKPNYDGGSSSFEEVKREMMPTEVVTGRLLTHYDETAGVALPHSAVEQHKKLGNTVMPLPESYGSRYDRLRSLLTGRLLPRREHLLQLRRQLQNCSTEVEAARKGIERETLNDTEQILERLRSVEAMRQSSIKHQVLQLEVELETIERVVRRIEQANSDTTYQPSTGVLITSAAPGSMPLESGIRGPRAASMVELIQQFSDLSSTIERLSSKTMTVQTYFPTDDFPKETAERLEILSRCDKYMHAVAVKDHMLWTVLKEKERQEELLEEEKKLSLEYAQEVAKWAEISQSLTHQVLYLKQEKDKLERRNHDLVNALRDNNVFYVTSEND